MLPGNHDGSAGGRGVDLHRSLAIIEDEGFCWTISDA